MQFSLGFVKSPQQFILRHFPNNEIELNKGAIMDLSEISQQNLQGLIFPAELSENAEFISEITDEKMHLPMKSDKDLHMDIQTFESMDKNRAQMTLNQIQSGWVLQNNILLMEGMFATLRHLRELLANDRTAFFEELWFLLKVNLGAHEFKIIFNDVKRAHKQHEKNKLIHILIDGQKNPTPREGGDMALQLMKSYDKYFDTHFEMIDYSKDKGEFVAAASIDKSPILIMGQVISLSRLQKAIIQMLFDGLQTKTLH